jgi:nucleolysin TIA-1/TIAR
MARFPNSVGYPVTPLTSAAAQYGQQGNYGGPAAQSPAGYGPQMGFSGPPSAGGYGRGQQLPNAQWAPPQGPNAAYGGYQG